MQMERNYRTILPSPLTNGSTDYLVDNGVEANSGLSGAVKGCKRQRRATAQACNNCRERKIGCNGQQPCSHCNRRGVICKYAALSKTILKSIPSGMKLLDETTAKTCKDSAELLDLLHSVSDYQVRHALNQLQAGRDARNVVDQLRGQLHSICDVSFHGLLGCVLPPDQNSIEFELMVRHAIAYSSWAPTKLPSLAFDFVLGTGTGFTVESSSTKNSPIFRGRSSPPPYMESESSSFAGWPHSTPTESIEGNSNLNHRSRDMFNDREDAAADFPPLCDERLLKADILAWTSVKITSLTVKRALSLYLETDHAITALFDVDLVLDDLVSGSTRFCSRLLVNSVLSWACQAYTAYDLEAISWSYSFYDEAELILEHETAIGLATPSTVAALLYLSMSSNCHAKSTTDSNKHLDHAVDLAKSIGLFGIADDGISERWPDGAFDFLWEKALTQTAWGSFVYITMRCAQNQMCKIAYPPRAPIPGDADGLVDAKFPGKPHFPPYMGRTFPLVCKLALIAHEMIWMNYGYSLCIKGHTMVRPMEVLYRQFLEWADHLPLELVRNNESADHVLLLHIYFHACVLDLFRPLVQNGNSMEVRLESFTSQHASPEAVCLASATQLGRIVITYLQKCSSASHSFLWSTGLLYFANAALREVAYVADNSKKLSELRMCIWGYGRLYRSFRLSQGIVQSLLSMALRKGLMESSEARAIIKDSDEKGKHHRGHDKIRAPFLVDLDLATVDPAVAHVDSLVAEFEELAIFNEFTVITLLKEAPGFSSKRVGSEVEA
ncbi:hypothetical protein LZ30DRAFT_605329 [Colletotrichum cereale]|nr:hypothetical protein LZ30DRAFT_605329 [Colletotrichum cereale]